AVNGLGMDFYLESSMRPGSVTSPGNRANRYFAFIKATVVSNMRLENPHSLSYQLETLTRRPDTFVSVESKVDDAGSWLKSTETSGALLELRMPFSAFDSEASFMMAFTSSAVVSRAAMKERSTSETLMVGTRIA